MDKKYEISPEFSALKYRIYSKIPAAGLAFQPKKKSGRTREVGILERRDCAFNALKSGLRIPFQQKESS